MIKGTDIPPPTLNESGAYLLNARSVSNSYVISSKIVVVGMWEKKQARYPGARDIVGMWEKKQA